MSIPEQIKHFTWHVASHWGALVSGGMALVCTFAIERAFKSYIPEGEVPVWFWVGIVFISILSACFLAWREQYMSCLRAQTALDQRKLKQSVREGLSNLLDQGRSLYLQVQYHQQTLQPNPNEGMTDWERRLVAFVGTVLGKDYELGLYKDIELDTIRTESDYDTAMDWIKRYTERLEHYISLLRKNDWEGSITLTEDAKKLLIPKRDMAT